MAAGVTGQDGRWLREAMALARMGRGVTEPNPSVGCVIVRGASAVGRGRSEAAGGRHAEAVAAAGAGELARGATAYVTMEPCCHLNKRTPPCVPVLVNAGVARVVIACLDPNPAVNGEGVRQLRAAGVEVVMAGGELEAECRQMIAPFFARTILGRPYVTVKWAETADGFIAGAAGRRVQITGAAANVVVHRLRARSEAIVVGGGTVRRDDPWLTARVGEETGSGCAATRGLPVTRALLSGAEGIGGAGPGDQRPVGARSRQPLRCVMTRSGDLPAGARVLSTPEDGDVVVYRGGIAEALGDLHRRGVTHVLVESGGRLAAAMVAANVVDRAWVFRSPSRLGDGVPAIRLPGDWRQTGEAMAGADAVAEHLNPASPAYFGAFRSADAEQLWPADQLPPVGIEPT